MLNATIVGVMIGAIVGNYSWEWLTGKRNWDMAARLSVAQTTVLLIVLLITNLAPT